VVIVHRDDEFPASAGAWQVCDAMRSDVLSVVPEMTARELIHVLLENSISGAPVVNSLGKIVGVVSDTDVLRLAARETAAPAPTTGWTSAGAAQPGVEAQPMPQAVLTVKVPAPGAGCESEAALDAFQVRDIMTPVALSVRPTEPLGAAVRMMRQGRIHRLLVMEDGILHGIVTPDDVLGLLDLE
jgi:CBS domain-containing protein